MPDFMYPVVLLVVDVWWKIRRVLQVDTNCNCLGVSNFQN